MSDKPKWTPGPWNWDGPVLCGNDTCIDVDGFSIANIVEKNSLFNRFNQHVTKEQEIANKNLIGSSLDLYASLAEAVKDCRCTLKQRDSGHLVGCFAIAAHAALAKARGESQ